MEASGTTLTVLKNGAGFATPLTVTDATLTGGKVGFCVKCNNATLSNVNVDDFEGGDLVAGGRAGKNTRAWPLGMALGINTWQGGSCS
jgi:hypothetical protein